MKTKMKYVLPSLAVLSVLVLAYCEWSEEGATVTAEFFTPFELVSVYGLTAAPADACCPFPDCPGGRMVQTNANGMGDAAGLEDGDGTTGPTYMAVGQTSGCTANTQWVGCAMHEYAACNRLGATSYNAVGTVTFTQVNHCTYTFSGNTKIWHCPGAKNLPLTIGNGQGGVGIQEYHTSTPSTAANDFANGVNYFTAYNTNVTAFANPPNYPSGTVLILGKTIYTDPSQVVQFPWTLSGASCAPQNPNNPPTCLFNASLSPNLTMGTRPPL